MPTNETNTSRKARVDEMPHELSHQKGKPNSLIRSIQANFETVTGVFRRLARAHNGLDDDVAVLYDRVNGEVLPSLATHTHDGSSGGSGGPVVVTLPDHAHEAPGDGGTIDEDALALTDVTTNNATTLKHGFLKKLSGSSTQFMNGVGNWATPSGGGGGGGGSNSFSFFIS